MKLGDYSRHNYALILFQQVFNLFIDVLRLLPIFSKNVLQESVTEIVHTIFRLVIRATWNGIFSGTGFL